MAEWALLDSNRVVDAGSVLATSLPTAVAASATPHTKGAFVELIASTDFAADTLSLVLTSSLGVAGTDSSCLVDLAIGASGSEVVIVPDLTVGFTQMGTAFTLPIAIPTGSRISARVQHATGSTVVSMVLQLSGGGWNGREPGRRMVAYGVSTATSRGVSATVVGSANTKGAWVELTSATTAPCRRLLTVLGLTTASAAAGIGFVDIGVGASGSEVVVVPNVFFDATSNEIIRFAPLVAPVSIPAGSRIAARYQATVTTVTARPSVAVYGID